MIEVNHSYQNHLAGNPVIRPSSSLLLHYMHNAFSSTQLYFLTAGNLEAEVTCIFINLVQLTYQCLSAFSALNMFICLLIMQCDAAPCINTYHGTLCIIMNLELMILVQVNTINQTLGRHYDHYVKYGAAESFSPCQSNTDMMQVQLCVVQPLADLCVSLPALCSSQHQFYWKSRLSLL